MIDSIAGGSVVGTETPYQAPIIAPSQLHTLTLERNAVLVARVSKDSGYDLSMLQELRRALKEMFPCHQVFVWYDDVEFMAIQDKGYQPASLEGINASETYY